MVSENVRQQWLIGYKKTLAGLNEGRFNGAIFTSENESIGSLAAIVFYGACIRETLNSGVDDPNQANLLTLAILELFEEDDFESVIGYLAGKPLPSRITDMIEHYKAKLQSDVSNAMKMIDDIEFKVGFGDDDEG